MKISKGTIVWIFLGNTVMFILGIIYCTAVIVSAKHDPGLHEVRGVIGTTILTTIFIPFITILGLLEQILNRSKEDKTKGEKS